MTGPLATIPHMTPSKRPGQLGSSVARAALSSGAATAIDGAVYQVALAACAELAVASRPAYMVAATVGAVFGAVCNFSLNRWWVFRSSGKLGHEGLRYVIGSLLTLLVMQLALSALITRASVDPRAAWLPAKLFTWLAFSYPFQRLVVFRGAHR